MPKIVIWRAFVDECPHRKVPLSEGRIENDGTLFCSYHGWRFDGDGSCTHVPQVTSDEKMDVILSNPKSSCNAFPTKVINGLLFVWPSNDKDALLESELNLLHMSQRRRKVYGVVHGITVNYPMVMITFKKTLLILVSVVCTIKISSRKEITCEHRSLVQ